MALSEDQKAMLRLLAQREQGYDDLAALMGLSVEEVRARVKDALQQLEDEGAEPPPVEPPEPPAAPEPAAPAASEEPALPPSPPPAEAPIPTPPPAATPPVSRPRISLPRQRGPRAAIAAGVAALVLLVVVLLVGGGGSGSDTTAASEASTGSGEAASTAAESSDLTQAVLAPVGGGDAKGRAIFGRIKKNVVLQLEASGLEPSPPGSAYTVWLYKSPQLALRIGAVKVGKSGGIAAQFPLPTELLAYVASGAFDQVDVSLTEDAVYQAEIAKAKKEKRLPAHVGEDVLRGEITGPAIH